MKNLLTALNAVMKAAGYVQKGSKHAQGYKYANEADLLAVVRPAMVEHGLMLIGPTAVGELTIKDLTVYVELEWQIAHVSGEVWPTPIRLWGSANDQGMGKGTLGDKALYKAYTGATKYALFKLLLIATGDDPETEVAHTFAPGQEDAPAAPAPMATDVQKKAIGDLVTRLGWDGPAAGAFMSKTLGNGKVKRSELTVDEAKTVEMAMLAAIGGEATPAAPRAPMASDDQKAKIAQQMNRLGWAAEDGKTYLARKFQKTSRAQLTAAEASEMLAELSQMQAVA